jgi:predicted xylose isomerase-like sugar epimerase
MSDPKMTMEVPPQVRDFAVKSVDQAERAISLFMESASKSVAMVSSPMNDAAQQALAITEKNLKAALEHARKLMNARDINEVMPSDPRNSIWNLPASSRRLAAA